MSYPARAEGLVNMYSAFPKTSALLEPHNQIIQCHPGQSLGVFFPSAEKLVHPTASADWTEYTEINLHYYIFTIIYIMI